MPTFSYLSALILVLSLSIGCEKQPPERLEISPARAISMNKLGETEPLTVMAYDKKNRPWIDKLTPSWSSSDEAVVTVDEAGVVKAVGSGTAEITATAEGVSSTLGATVQIVGSVEIAKDTPTKLKMLKQDITLKVTVKDDKGNVIEKPQLTFTASDYCVDVTPKGFVHPQSVGKCSVTVSSRGVKDVHVFEVR